MIDEIKLTTIEVRAAQGADVNVCNDFVRLSGQVPVALLSPDERYMQLEGCLVVLTKCTSSCHRSTSAKPVLALMCKVGTVRTLVAAPTETD